MLYGPARIIRSLLPNGRSSEGVGAPHQFLIRMVLGFKPSKKKGQIQGVLSAAFWLCLRNEIYHALQMFSTLQWFTNFWDETSHLGEIYEKHVFQPFGCRNTQLL